jgi:hypothetical protein
MNGGGRKRLEGYRQDNGFELMKAGFERKACRILGKGDYLSDLIYSRSI